ncbi:MAG TPA: arylsulfatase, partial [Longimicrobiales bacterium]|nr:arylsulfatase [Longimicrobiales bacterium]
MTDTPLAHRLLRRSARSAGHWRPGAAIAVALAMLAGCVTPAVARQASPPPNVIFILADDLGYGDLGAFGQTLIRTPNLDRLAAEGMRFTNAYSGSTICAPARSVLMTGRHTGHTTVRGNFGEPGQGGVPDPFAGNALRVPLNADDVTVASVLKNAGYVTGLSGKWGLGEVGTTGVPWAHGFDEFFGYINQRHAHSYYPEFLWHNEERIDLPNSPGAPRIYSHDLITNYGLHFIREHSDTTFFLFMAFTLPHSDMDVPELGPYADVDWPDHAKTYAAMVSRLDADIGRITALLRELGIDDRTLILFASDNGPHDADGNDPEFFDSNGPFRGIKRDLYEGGIRVPGIAWWPGRVPAGTVSHTPWYFADVLPTLAELAGVAAPDDVDGVSILPTVLGEEQ